jgi:hypothetical protein
VDDICAKHVRYVREKQAQQQANKIAADHAYLVMVLEKKILTTAVGSLALLEKHFGWLWGDGKPEAELTENELAWREIFLRCRDEILDNGNRQIRGMRAEMDLHQVERQPQQIAGNRSTK